MIERKTNLFSILGMVFFSVGLMLFYLDISNSDLKSTLLLFVYSTDLFSFLGTKVIVFFSVVCFCLAYLFVVTVFFFNRNSFSVSKSEDKIGASGKKGSFVGEHPNDFENKEHLKNQIEKLNISISKARHDLFNLMLDMNGIHSADDAQRSLEYLEESASILKSMKNLVNHD